MGSPRRQPSRRSRGRQRGRRKAERCTRSPSVPVVYDHAARADEEEDEQRGRNENYDLERDSRQLEINEGLGNAHTVAADVIEPGEHSLRRQQTHERRRVRGRRKDFGAQQPPQKGESGHAGSAVAALIATRCHDDQRVGQRVAGRYSVVLDVPRRRLVVGALLHARSDTLR
eukprot:scaffold222674_cov24-Tisochrysis_lutea.AAC.2